MIRNDTQTMTEDHRQVRPTRPSLGLNDRIHLFRKYDSPRSQLAVESCLCPKCHLCCVNFPASYHLDIIMCINAGGSQETQPESATMVQMPSRWNGSFATILMMQ